MYLITLFILSLVHLRDSFVSSIQFTLRAGEEICLSEDVSANDLIVGEFTILPANQRIQVTLQDPNDQLIYSKAVASQESIEQPTSGTGEITIEPSKFAHTSKITGEYRSCFANTETSTTKQVSFNLRTGSTANKDYSQLAKQESLKPIEVELKKLEDTVGSILNDMKYMSKREKEMRQTNDSIGRRVLWMSLISFILLLTAKSGEIIYLRRYFHSKRLI